MRLYLLALLPMTAALGQLAKGNGTLSGVHFRYETRLEPKEPGITRIGNGTITGDSTIKRHVLIYEKKLYFGYDLRLEPLGNGRVRCHFSPTSATPEMMGRLFPGETWVAAPSPVMPAPQEVGPGDELVFDLFVNPQTGQRIVEHLSIGAEGQLPRAVFRQPPDMKMADVWMTLGNLRVGVGGQEYQVGGGGYVSGNQVWFTVPQRGRVYLTLAPRPGYERNGEATPRSFVLRLGGEVLVAACDQRLLPGEGSFALYVRHDRGYRGEAAVGAQ